MAGQEFKKEEQEQLAAKTVQAELTSALQTRGMDINALMGRPEIKNIIGEAGRAPSNSVQARAREMTRSFLSRSGLTKGASSTSASVQGRPTERKDAPKIVKK